MRICGIDEAGRGTLAGSLFVAGVVLEIEIEGLRDSKKLSKKNRFRLYDEIVQNASFHIVESSAQKVDSLGLGICLKESILEICAQVSADSYIMDGNTPFGVQGVETLIGGDSLLPCISAASILAKASKDREMERLDRLHPEYGFAKHCGYGTKAHLEAILHLGYSPFHRQSFKLKRLLYPTLF